MLKSVYIYQTIKPGLLGLCHYQDLVGLSHFRSFLLYPYFSAASLQFLAPSPQPRLDLSVCPSQNLCFTPPFLLTSTTPAGGAAWTELPSHTWSWGTNIIEFISYHLESAQRSEVFSKISLESKFLLAALMILFLHDKSKSSALWIKFGIEIYDLFFFHTV